jgi:3-oxoacyl-[acyl-carrier protein] reductase
MKVQNKVILITGAGSGIGRETAIMFAKNGANVVVTDVDEIGGKATVDEIVKIIAENPDCKGDAFFTKLDTSNREQTKLVAKEIIDKYGEIDVLVNNAGIIQDALVTKMTEDQWNRVIDVDLKGPFNMVQSVVDNMIEHKIGEIINVSSVVGVYGNVGQANYSAAKAGLIGLTKTLAKELGKKGIRVNAVAPGFIQTHMTASLPEKVLTAMKDKTPLKRLGLPSDVAYAIMFLASDEANFINGIVLPVDGGLVI